MRRWPFQEEITLTLLWLRRFANGTIGVVSANLAASPEGSADIHPFLGDLVSFGHEVAWLTIVLSLVTVWVATYMLRRLGDPTILEAIDEILDQFRDGVFGGDAPGDDAHHRVTLFKHFRFRLAGWDVGNGGWPWSGWLVPVARSGHTSQRSSARFLAPDDTDRAQGIAGRAWARRRAAAVMTELPDVRADGCIPKQREDYAKRTNVRLRWVEKRRPAARSLMGFTVENTRGRPWGVLVIDSRSPGLDSGRANTEYQNYGRVLARLVEGI